MYSNRRRSGPCATLLFHGIETIDSDDITTLFHYPFFCAYKSQDLSQVSSLAPPNPLEEIDKSQYYCST
jgi:hypothetical protein